MLNLRRVSLVGRGGTEEDLDDDDVAFLVTGGAGGLVDEVSFVKNDSSRVRSVVSPLLVGLSLPAIPMSIWASRLES